MVSIAYIEITYEGKNITQEIAPFITAFTYTDNASGKADDIALTLEDRDSLWLNDWMPSKGDVIRPAIIAQGYRYNLGTFQADEISYSYPPRTLSIKAVSCAVTGRARFENHNQAWESVTVKDIAGSIAEASGLSLYYDAEDFPVDRKEQIHQADLPFLEELCGSFGLNVKIHDDTLVVYSEREYSGHDSAVEISSEDSRLLTVKFTSKSAKIYRKARVKYHHPVKNEVYEAEYEDEDAEGTEQELELYEAVDSQQQAEEIAKESLTSANSKEVTAELTLTGDIFAAGNNITLSGFGMFSGKYFADKVTHTITNGWTTQLSLKMGGGAKKAVQSAKAKVKAKAKSGGGILLADDSEGY
ncbi:MAG: hypothetical protein II877_11615 [Synergistaceae bacterium]|nr:hypothetical protein [Synergistaceae bacterium]MBQ7168436.1 hypothetical protein [Synergistaceae bacterium]